MNQNPLLGAIQQRGPQPGNSSMPHLVTYSSQGTIRAPVSCSSEAALCSSRPYANEESTCPMIVEASRHVLEAGGKCDHPIPSGACHPSPQIVQQYHPESATIASDNQLQYADSTPQQPVSPASQELVGEMVTSCDMAASIIAEICGHRDTTTARLALGCSTNAQCSIRNLTFFEPTERCL